MPEHEKESKTSGSESSSTAQSLPQGRPKRKILGIDRDTLKIVLGTLVLVGIVTFVIQNLDAVEITFIWTLEISRAILYPGIFLAGTLFGWIVKSLSMRRQMKAKK